MKLKKISKILLFALLTLITPFFLYAVFVFYDWQLSQSGRMSNEFNKKVEKFIKEKRGNFELKELTDFEWDKVCFYGGDGQESINLKDEWLIKEIGFKPQFLFRSKFWIDYDLSGLLFVNTNDKKVYVLHHIRAWYHLPIYASGPNVNANYFYTGCHKNGENLSFSLKNN